MSSLLKFISQCARVDCVIYGNKLMKSKLPIWDFSRNVHIRFSRPKEMGFDIKIK